MTETEIIVSSKNNSQVIFVGAIILEVELIVFGWSNQIIRNKPHTREDSSTAYELDRKM